MLPTWYAEKIGQQPIPLWYSIVRHAPSLPKTHANKTKFCRFFVKIMGSMIGLDRNNYAEVPISHASNLTIAFAFFTQFTGNHRHTKATVNKSYSLPPSCPPAHSEEPPIDEEDDTPLEPCPTYREVFQAASVISRYAGHVDDPVARTLEAILASFGRQMRLERSQALTTTHITDYFQYIK